MAYKDEWAFAHEIKNPIALAKVNVSLIRQDDEERRFEGYCTQIERALDNINRLVQKFLQPDDTPVIKKFDLSVLLAELIAEYRSAWPQIAFNYQSPAAPIWFEGEPDKLRIVFSNLLKNASEVFREKGWVAVDVETEGDFICVTIRDNGCGLDDSFNKNRSGRSGFSSKPGGSGLGLTICETILKNWGGALHLDNSPYGGCVAVVTLPAFTLVTKTPSRE